MNTQILPDTLQHWLDRAAITQVVQDWGLARDTGRWDQLRACFTDDGTMSTTWFVGSADEFVARSTEGYRRGARAQHFVGAASIELRGDKAIAETRMILMARGKLDGLEVEVTCYGRFYDRFVKDAQGWRIHKRGLVYEKDRMDVINPADVLQLDRDELARYPYGYRHLAYLQGRSGLCITPDLPVPDSAALERMYAEASVWLHDIPPALAAATAQA